MSECRETKERAVAWLNGTLDEARYRCLTEHCAACRECAEILAVARVLKESLREATKFSGALPASFDVNLHRALADVADRQRRRALLLNLLLPGRPLVTYLVVFFLCVAAIVMVTFFRDVPSPGTVPQEPGTLISRAEVKAGGPITVELTYEVARDIAETNVIIELGEGISFFSDISGVVSRKTLRWSGPLHKGKNLIPFVVMVERPGTWSINTTALYEGKRHRHRVVLSADTFKVVIAQYSFPPEMVDVSTN